MCYFRREKIAQYKEDKEKRLTQKAEVEKLKNETDQPAKKEGKDKQKPEEKTNSKYPVQSALIITTFA